MIKFFCSKLYFLFITEHHCWYVRDTKHGLHVQKEVCCMWLGRGHLRFLGHSTANASPPASTQHSAVVALGYLPLAEHMISASPDGQKQHYNNLSVPLNICHIGWATGMHVRHQITYHVNCVIPDFCRTRTFLQ